MMETTKYHILIVDDDEMSRLLYLHLFNAEGYKVTSASDGHQALLQLEEHDDIDLIVTDINMPVISGIELIKSLKKKEPPVPVLIVSGTRDLDIISELKGWGFNHYLAKPVKLALLRETVKKIISELTGQNNKEQS